MRRILAVLTVAVCLGGLMSCKPTEPAMTITAKDVRCNNASLAGVVTPASASKKVVLQRTVNGKWVDWKWYSSSDPTAAIIEATVYQDNGEYQLDYNDENPGGVKLSGTIHVRARSAGGTAFSNGVYVKFPQPC